MKTRDVQKLYDGYVLPTYRQTPVCLVRGKGSRVWDLQGREYIDFFPGWGVSGLGHCHPAVVSAIKNQARKILHISNNFLNVKQAELAREIVRHSFPGKVFFCNSGAEATDGAVKFARRWGASAGRYEIITLRQSFHGRTLAGIAATGQEKVREGFAPTLEGFRYAEMNNLASVERCVNEKTVAIFLEPIQGEGGIHQATQSFMKGLRSLCDQRGLLLMLDEVQTCMGRTGKMFAYQLYDIEPDVMTLAKSLGAGVPIGAFVVHQKKLGEVMIAGTHGSTYGGNPLVCAASLAVFKAIRKERLLAASVKWGAYFGKKLDELKSKYAVIKEIRGAALMRGVELTVPGAGVAERCLQRGLLINCTQERVLRLMPALTITKKLLDQALAILDQALSEETV